MPRRFLGRLSNTQGTVWAVFALLVNAIVWYSMTLMIIERMINSLSHDVSTLETILIWGAYHLAIIGSGLVGAKLTNRIDKRRLLYLWIIFGAITSALPALITDLTMTNITIICSLLGASLGLGMPSCLSHFADRTIVENRGLIGGSILMITNIIAALFSILFAEFALTGTIVIFVIWRASILSVFLFKPKLDNIPETKKEPSLTSVIQDRSFILFFIAWLMFCLIDRFETPIQKVVLAESYSSMLVIGTILGSISAFVGGLLADRIGRKKILLYGFVSLGVAYAIIGITAAPLVTWYLSLSVISISTGILWVHFIFVIWGDLAKFVTSEKYYAIGIMPFFISHLVQLFSAGYISEISEIPISSSFSLAAFFLFLAVLPLLYAPETLPEKKMELRRLRKFADEARKAKEKYETKK